MDQTSSITTTMNVFSLADEEDGGIEIVAEEVTTDILQGQGFDANLCIVGRFIQEGRVDFEAMQQTLVVLWKPGKGVYMKELDSNLFLFQFYHEVDVRRVMEGCPWSFNRKSLVMSRLQSGQNPRSVDLNHMELWVQVHDLKAGSMSEKILQGISNYVGSFVSTCPSNFVKPIGAKWLRNGDGSNSSSSQFQSHGSPVEEDEESLDPKIAPANLAAGTQGENQGDKIIQKKDIGARQMHSNVRINATELATNQEVNEMTVIETKKRRTGDGPDTEVLMDSDDISELGFDNAGQNSKNAYGASTQVGARLLL
ncbi:hypothetical protein POM88_016765 [Heracleum sosnowskyi]|uniref:DUF4283 domain-containing protein n=1 Tax=Heracleum sosnowskyi TaxID=360622 RepID=A0AAD8IQF6_9APIA|nr:hypothetical protein POM88_016765 [Heracleum sosnowskyi]